MFYLQIVDEFTIQGEEWVTVRMENAACSMPKWEYEKIRRSELWALYHSLRAA